MTDKNDDFQLRISQPITGNKIDILVDHQGRATTLTMGIDLADRVARELTEAVANTRRRIAAEEADKKTAEKAKPPAPVGPKDPKALN